MRKLLKAFGILAGLVVVALGLTFAFFDFDKVLNGQKDKYLPELEKLLGRKVSAGEIKTTFLPVLGAELHDVVVEGKAPGEPPLLKIDQITFQAELWKAIASAGTNVELKALLVNGLTVNLTREADGTLSYQDVLDRLADGPPPEEAPKPLDPEAIKFLENLHLARIAIQDSRFHLVDKATGGAPAETYVNDLLVELDDVYLSRAFEVHIAAGVLAEKRNFDLRVSLGPVPIGKQGEVPVHSVALKADGIELANIVPYLGRELPVRIQSARFGADLTVDDPMAAKGPIKLDGSLGLANVVVATPEPGEAFDLKVTPKVTFDPKAGVLDLTGFSLALGDMTLSATGKVDGIGGYPRFHDVKITTDKMDLGRLQKMLPPIKTALPPGATLDGPFAIALTASGDTQAQDVDLNVDLDGTRISLPKTFQKGPGTALHTRVQAHITPNDLDLKKLQLALGDLNLDLAGTIKNFQKPTIDIRGGTGKFDINGPSRLLPAVAAAIPPDVKVAGQAEIDLDVQGNAHAIDAKVLLGIYGADLAVPGATVRGTGKLEATAKGNPANSLALAVDGGLSGLTIEAGEAFRKPAGAPFEVKLRASKAGARIDVPELLVHLGPLNLTGNGALGAAGDADMKVKIARFAVNDLATLLPAMKDTPIGGATIGLTAAFRGDPAKPATVQAAMDDFYFAKGKSSVAGKLSVENLDAPKIRFDFASPVLDLDELFPPGPEQAQADSGSSGGEPPPIVKKLDVAGRITVARGVAREFPFTNFVASMTMQNGIVNFDKLDFDSYEGHFSAAPTKVDIGAASPAFDIQVAMKNVSAERLFAEQLDMPNTLSGRMSTEMQMKGKGAQWAQISKNLSGSLGMALANGRLHKLDVQQEVMGGAAKKLPFLNLPKSAGGTALRDLAGKFTIADGQMKLLKPMVAQTGQGPLELDGAIGLDSSLDLKGSMAIAPAAIATLTQNKVKPQKPIPVGLKLGGTLTDPKVSGVEADALVELLTTEFAKAMGLEKLDEARRKAEEAAAKAKEAAEAKIAEAKARAEAAKAQAQAKAKQAVDEAKKKAEEAKKKAQAEAEKKKQEAKKKAEAEAKKKLKGLF